MPLIWIIGALLGVDYAQKKGIIKPIWTSPRGRPGGPPQGQPVGPITGRASDSMAPGTMPGAPEASRPIGPPATVPGLLQSPGGQTRLAVRQMQKEMALQKAEKSDLDVEGKVARKAQMLPMLAPIMPESGGPDFSPVPQEYTPDSVSIEELGEQGLKASNRGGF